MATTLLTRLIDPKKSTHNYINDGLLALRGAVTTGRIIDSVVRELKVEGRHLPVTGSGGGGDEVGHGGSYGGLFVIVWYITFSSLFSFLSRGRV